MKPAIHIKNKKAYYQYELLDKFQAGIELNGTEIKSVRLGRVSLADAYCFFSEKELYVRGMHIAEYELRGYVNHDPRRDRKLLLTRRELNKLERSVREKGLTLVATRLYINERGLAKLEIALARGKRQYDKREVIRKRETSRDLKRAEKRK